MKKGAGTVRPSDRRAAVRRWRTQASAQGSRQTPVPPTARQRPASRPRPTKMLSYTARLHRPPTPPGSDRSGGCFARPSGPCPPPPADPGCEGVWVLTWRVVCPRWIALGPKTTPPIDARLARDWERMPSAAGPYRNRSIACAKATYSLPMSDDSNVTPSGDPSRCASTARSIDSKSWI